MNHFEYQTQVRKDSELSITIIKCGGIILASMFVISIIIMVGAS